MQIRHAQFGEADGATRTAPLVLSTEEPVRREGYIEVLDHSPGAVDLSRQPLPLLVGHDTQPLPIGVIENLVVSDRKLRGVARFSDSPRAQEIFRDIAAGIVRGVSIGYQYTDEGTQVNRDTIRFKFAPYEASAVSVPADRHAGFFRGKNMNTEEQHEQHQSRGARRLAEEQRALQQLSTVPAADAPAFRQYVAGLADEHEISEAQAIRSLGDVAAAYELWRAEGIRKLAERYKTYPAIERVAIAAELDPQKTLADFRRQALQILEDAHRPETRTGDLSDDDRQRSLGIPFGEGVMRLPSTGPLQSFNGRDAEKRAYEAGMWILSISRNGERSEKAAQWCREHGVFAKRVMGEGVFSLGGAAVPDAIANEILSNAEKYGVFRRFSRVWPMTTATMAVPTSLQGLTMTAVGENVATTTSDLSMGQVNLTPKEFAGGTRLSRALLEDAIGSLGDFLVTEFARVAAQTEDKCGFIADGTAPYGGMLGVVYKIENQAAFAGAKVAMVTAAHDTFGEIDVVDLGAVMGAVPEYARPGAAWYCSATFKDLVFSRLAMAGAGNNVQTIAQGAGESFAGYPIRTSPIMPAGATTDYSNKVICLFGNLAAGTAFGDRRTLFVEIDQSRYIEFRQSYYQVGERLDVNCHLLGTTATVCGPIAGLVGGTA